MANTTVYHPKKQKHYDAASEKSMNYIGKVLSKARNNKGLSLMKFSAVLKDYGVSATASAIQKWENGSNTPTPISLLPSPRRLIWTVICLFL